MDRPRYYDVLGHRVHVERSPDQPREPRALSLPWLLAYIGLAITALHELIYRQTGGDEFPVLRVVSHAGGDMLGLLLILVSVAAIVRRASDRGVR